MEARGQRLAERTVQALDALLTSHALHFVNALARARKVSPHHVALQVPGLCHTHGPDTRVFDGSDGGRRCAYCARRGNCFSGG